MPIEEFDTLFAQTAVTQNEKAYCALEELIVTGGLPPGSQWSEIALAETISLGRTPTREALQKLAYQGLVRIAPRQGVFICDVDYQGQLKVIQARREIERLIVAQAAQWANAKELASLQQIARELENLKKTKDMRMYMRLHFALTRVLGEASRNSYAAEFYSKLQTLARRFLYFHPNRHNIEQICDLHIQQVKAVIARDIKAAISSAEARNDYAETFARDILMEMIATSAVTIRLTDT